MTFANDRGLRRISMWIVSVGLVMLFVSPGGQAVAGDVQAASANKKKTGVRLQFHLDAKRPTTGRLEVTGLTASQLATMARWKADDDAWWKLLRIYVVDDSAPRNDDQPAMLGSYKVENGRILFRPRFPYRAGLKYRAELSVDRLTPRTGGKPIKLTFGLPKPAPTPLATVTQVYPSRSKLPENLLKFYIHFSAPMSRGEAYSRVQLLDAKGKAIEFPFLELGEELWDPSGTRFTLFFDPGRIKRGLKPRELFGPALETGKSYTLVIDRRWNDAKGRALKATFRKKFKVGDPDDRQPDPKTWKVTTPAAGSRNPLIVTFPDPLDHALLQRLLVVKDAKGRFVAGASKIDRHETRWQFTPKTAWPAGAYSLEITTTLEDLAGNSVGRPFEVDVVRRIGRKIETKVVSLPFRVSNAK